MTIPDVTTAGLLAKVAQAPTMTEDEALDAKDEASRIYTSHNLHHLRPADKQGNTDQLAWDIRAQRAAAAAQLWLAAAARLDEL